MPLTDQQMANLGFNAIDKPFHRPECCCDDCCRWRVDNGRLQPDCADADWQEHSRRERAKNKETKSDGQV